VRADEEESLGVLDAGQIRVGSLARHEPALAVPRFGRHAPVALPAPGAVGRSPAFGRAAHERRRDDQELKTS
jgi:hypothetical protein